MEQAWAAGFFDGEGCVGAYPNRTSSPRLRVQISQCDRDVLDRFARAVGAGRVTGPYQQRRANDRPYFQFQAQGADAETTMIAVLPFLGRIKLQQMIRAAVKAGL